MSVSFCQTLFKLFYGAPKRSRTPNLLIRSQTLYPIELWALIQFVSSTCISLSLLSNLVKHFFKLFMARPRGVEPLTFWSVVKRSIQLSYGRLFNLSHRLVLVVYHCRWILLKLFPQSIIGTFMNLILPIMYYYYFHNKKPL